MKVKVDYDLCESNGLCVMAAPDVFDLRDDDQLYVLDETPDESRRAAVEDAVQVCPKQALRIEG
ncbi:ferredoxin [Amycolatopsis thermophila]|uniref:Ferredoxin n=1 Tax=Amycolatopsis thermophila TaxID=206084 RepID=A0ABU0F5Y8_9PSEU|nr:ferredoxin [Amycolatopsis thermophila]MDQ0382749.1 ferredoxin [Amycolatopsis thermophila]